MRLYYEAARSVGGYCLPKMLMGMEREDQIING